MAYKQDVHVLDTERLLARRDPPLLRHESDRVPADLAFARRVRPPHQRGRMALIVVGLGAIVALPWAVLYGIEAFKPSASAPSAPPVVRARPLPPSLTLPSAPTGAERVMPSGQDSGRPAAVPPVAPPVAAPPEAAQKAGTPEPPANPQAALPQNPAQPPAQAPASAPPVPPRPAPRPAPEVREDPASIARKPLVRVPPAIRPPPAVPSEEPEPRVAPVPRRASPAAERRAEPDPPARSLRGRRVRPRNRLPNSEPASPSTETKPAGGVWDLPDALKPRF